MKIQNILIFLSTAGIICCNHSTDVELKTDKVFVDNRKSIFELLDDNDSIFFQLNPIKGTEDWNISWGNKEFSGKNSIAYLTNGHNSVIPPVVVSFDQNFIELRTNGSANYFETLILPLRQQFTPQFFSENILLFDKEQLRVLTFDSNVHNQADTFSIRIFDLVKSDYMTEQKLCKCKKHLGFPWFDSCVKQNESYIFKTHCGEIVINP